jgi:predicted ABC-type ATPase
MNSSGPGMKQPLTCWIIAGPNGAGKTTFALEYLPRVAHCRHFINRVASVELNGFAVV